MKKHISLSTVVILMAILIHAQAANKCVAQEAVDVFWLVDFGQDKNILIREAIRTALLHTQVDDYFSDSQLSHFYIFNDGNVRIAKDSVGIQDINTFSDRLNDKLHSGIYPHSTKLIEFMKKVVSEASVRKTKKVYLLFTENDEYGSNLEEMIKAIPEIRAFAKRNLISDESCLIVSVVRRSGLRQSDIDRSVMRLDNRYISQNTEYYAKPKSLCFSIVAKDANTKIEQEKSLFSEVTWGEVLSSVKKAIGISNEIESEPDEIIKPRKERLRSAKDSLLMMRNNNNRFAVIIGNSDYIHSSKLKNPINDAKAIEQALTELNFATTIVENVKLNDIKKIQQHILTTCDSAYTVLFYYSGHGIQVNGENYLVPVEANITRESDIKQQCFNLDSIMIAMNICDSCTKILILDACRTGITEKKGLEGIIKGLAPTTATTGCIISYATAPNKVAYDLTYEENGLFTKYLVKHIKRANISIEECFKRVRTDVLNDPSNPRMNQVPWESTSLLTSFSFSLIR